MAADSLARLSRNLPPASLVGAVNFVGISYNGSLGTSQNSQAQASIAASRSASGLFPFLFWSSSEEGPSLLP